MTKKAHSLRGWHKRGLLAFSALVLGVAALVIAPASASASVGIQACRKVDVGMTNQWAHIQEPQQPVDYWYSEWLWVPHWSSCRDLNIGQLHVPGDPNANPCVDFRARSYFTLELISGWKRVCQYDGWRVIKWGMTNGYPYRVEARSVTNSNYRPYYTVMD